MNLPNLLASARIVLAPILFILLTHSNVLVNTHNIHISWINYLAALIFTIASITDFFDGYIARSWNQKTILGEILDPLADKMLTLAAFLGLMMMGRVNEILVYFILVREFFITGLRVMIVADGLKIAANMSGKIKTTFQMLAIGFLLMDWWGKDILFYLCFFFTIYSGAIYVIEYAKAKK
ncbi:MULTISPECIES: CDP-diacylglycerol--glycerol-3-phosphate 3-phosphatidyltransferase [unclassified Campylobacter]|uniref:CDP-diacylglycerol--glycerol-3-phosphate 3-phosphatidyltransferase n=1 Tax=unclassified Campylobacter TaxID=2593542 RepID=UPI001BDAE31F|nr:MULTISPECIES: CDP-diacylglycerol--glycerol-3-phosphate 3-phosphatidyltransferase [unclassified Campylobacter]MBZ7976434.1 CDP-diacylglycerol--glycerol-3-phosphate 3-phosphatidyltransferase [Campylobacter sp. RM12637]MBZ7978292.1 CDP-diacylglycerol--glycerol-3-phosphate 3-phosphatidyltransferase [Campylobacter sp. RM12654]MBZ7980124.1 CDP-diacylglycerol--glycerol-3-phosphate 3-phosphatidyltransferase [Campylobacter sp. RM12642]MBZ7982589.1 CDP-diacylglycerol--glycerol-3-phosphate 3-phosphatid